MKFICRVCDKEHDGKLLLEVADYADQFGLNNINEFGQWCLDNDLCDECASKVV